MRDPGSLAFSNNQKSKTYIHGISDKVVMKKITPLLWVLCNKNSHTHELTTVDCNEPLSLASASFIQ